MITMAGAQGGAERGSSSSPAAAAARGAGASCDAGGGGARLCASTIFQRNGASLSVAAAQPHAWVHSWHDYVALAHAAATRRATRHALRRAAEAGRQRGTLFDMAHWGRGFAAAAHGAEPPRSSDASMAVRVPVRVGGGLVAIVLGCAPAPSTST